MSVMQTTKVNFLFFFFLFCTKIPVLIILVTETKLKIPICMPIRKDGIEQFVGTYMAYLHMAYIHMGRKYRPKASSVAGNLISLTSPNQEERGQQAKLQTWEGKSSGSEINGRKGGYLGLFRGGGWNGFRTAGIASAHPYQCHGVDPRCRK